MATVRNTIMLNKVSSDEQIRDVAAKTCATQVPRPRFTVIWSNLVHRVDSRPWNIKLKEKLLRRPAAHLGSDIETNCGAVRGEKIVLNKISGSIKSGELTGILGPSGAGKSTLIHCLFQNRSDGTSGRILVDTNSIKKRLKVCFIPQKDYLNEWLTVREDLIFVSKLKSARVDHILRNNSHNSLNSKIDESNLYVRQNGSECSTSLIDHEVNALRVSELLGLNSCLDVKIRNISGGQKKRLSIARELMSKPNILVLDEPTTGLDSLTCHKTIQVLRDLSRQSAYPLAVVVTIHQPSKAVFDMFDKTYFLSNKGQVAYEGSPRDVAKTLESVAGVCVPAPNFNQAATLIEISSSLVKTSVVEKLTAHQRTTFERDFDESYLKRLMQPNKDSNWTFCALGESQSANDSFAAIGDASRHLQQQQGEQKTSALKLGFEHQSTAPKESNCGVDSLDNGLSASTTSSLDEDSYFISHYLRDCLSSHSNSIVQSCRHVFILTHRSWLSNIRNPTLTRSRLVFHAALPLIMLLIFATNSGTPNSCPPYDNDITVAEMKKSLDDAVIRRNVDEIRFSLENVSFYFILMYGFGINIISSTASHYPLTIHMFTKETINGLYGAGPYLIGQTLAELPLEIFYPSFSVLISYSLSGQPSSYLEWRMFAITLIMLLYCYTIHSLGLLFGSIFVNNISVAVLLGQVALFPPIMFSGFLVRVSRMTPWMHTTSLLVSPFLHAMNGVVAARYGFNICNCSPDLLPDEDNPAGFNSLPSNVRHVLDYMFPKNTTDDIQVSGMFDKLSERFSMAQTFAMNITTCDQVIPYAMTAFKVTDFHLLRGAIALLSMIIVLKLVTFSIVKLSPYRIR